MPTVNVTVSPTTNVVTAQVLSGTAAVDAAAAAAIQARNMAQHFAEVAEEAASSGGGGGSSTIAGLSDVQLSSPLNLNLFYYNAAASKWANASIAALGIATSDALDTKLNSSSVVNNLTSVSTTAPLSAAQGKALKDSLDAISALLASDELTLDSLQEVVDYIIENRSTLESLGIANIAGLSAALAAKAPLNSPSFTGTVAGISKSMVGLSNVDNTSDSAKPVSTAQQAALNLKASLASPTFTGTVGGITASMVGLGNVNNTADSAKPVSTAQQAALDLKVAISAIVNTLTSTSTTAPLSAAMGKSLKDQLDAAVIGGGGGATTFNALTDTEFNDLEDNDLVVYDTATAKWVNASISELGAETSAGAQAKVDALEDTIDAALATKAPLASPTFTGTVTAPTFAGALTGNAASATVATTLTLVATNTTNATHYPVFVDAATGNENPRTDTGWTYNPSTGVMTVTQVTGALSGNASTATALATARTINGVSFSGTANITVTANTPNALTLSSAGGGASPGSTFNGGAAVTISYDSIGAIAQSSVVNNLTSTSTTAPLSAAQGKTLKDLVDAISALLASDETTLDSLQEVVDYIMANRATLDSLGIANVSGLNAALDSKAPLASPTFTGTVGGITKSMVGLGSVDNTSDAAKPISTATQSALDAKAPTASPTFTGTVSGITKSMVGLGNVDNTADSSKPVSTAQQTALDLKVNAANPSFTGSITEQVHTMTGTVLEPDNGTVQEKTLSAPATLTDGLATGHSLVLHLLNGATHAVTWPTITWVSSTGNDAPTLTANDTLVFWKIGSTLYGIHAGNSV